MRFTNKWSFIDRLSKDKFIFDFRISLLTLLKIEYDHSSKNFEFILFNFSLKNK